MSTGGVDRWSCLAGGPVVPPGSPIIPPCLGEDSDSGTDDEDEEEDDRINKRKRLKKSRKQNKKNKKKKSKNKKRSRRRIRREVPSDSDSSDDRTSPIVSDGDDSGRSSPPPSPSPSPPSPSPPRPPSPLPPSQVRHLASKRIPVVLRIQTSKWKALQFATHIFFGSNEGISNIGITTMTSFKILGDKINRLLDSQDQIGDDKWGHQTFIYSKTLAQVSYDIICIMYFYLNLL